MIIAAIFYAIALLTQCMAAVYAMTLYHRAHTYRLAFGLFAAGLALMIGRRINPLLVMIHEGYFNLVDAILSAIISALLFFGILGFKRILIDLENKNMKLAEYAKTDSLTGALSRLEVFVKAKTEIERSLRSGHATSFLMIDIDHFKNVNDRYGHPNGDAILKDLVRHCHDQLRSIDIFGRVGGEEFFAILPECTQDIAYQVANRLRQYVEGQSTELDRHQKVSITISIGIASFDPKNANSQDSTIILRDFYRMADEAMYQAKSKGRNRVEVYD